MVDDEFGIVPNAPNKGRPPAGLPGKPQEINARLCGNTAFMRGDTLRLEGVNLKPAVIIGKTRRPDESGNVFRRQIKGFDRVSDALWIWANLARFGVKR